jgi:nuclear GTP-binding protein
MVCKTAPVPGETKVWQYITLTRRIYLIDCPGVVPPNPNDTPEQILLRGVVRVENVENPAQYVQTALGMCQRRHIERTYELKNWQTADEFLELMARKTGKLLKGGEADMDAVAKMVLNDFLRGRIPWYVAPPRREVVEGEGGEEGIEGRKGRLGEMAGMIGKKRKIDDVDVEGDRDSEAKKTESIGKGEDNNDEDEDEDSQDDEFEAFNDIQDGGLVVGPDAFGNLDGFAIEEDEDEEDEDSVDEEEDEEEDEDEDDDAKTLIPDDEATSSDDERAIAKQLNAEPVRKRRRKG